MRLKVWLTQPNGTTLSVGEIVAGDPEANGAIPGQFRYDQDYLNHSHAFALDPFHLPLVKTVIDADRPQAGVHGVFEDSLPDDWGRRIMVRRFKLARTEQRVPQFLQLLGGDGLGALSYCDNPPDKRQNETGVENLERLTDLAVRFEKDNSLQDDALTLLFEAGSSPGGARPKALLGKNETQYIVKFPSFRDQFDVVGLEAATMALARTAGIDTAPCEIFTCGQKRVLLVERFDITPEGGRKHLASMQTLTGAEGFYHLGYSDLVQVIRKISFRPAEDLNMLFRQMLFNVMIGNTDDHLKNFCMYHDQEGWRLSPAFDLLPNVGNNREHQLHIGSEYFPPGCDIFLREAKHFGIKQQQKAMDVIKEVYEAVSYWHEVFGGHRVPGHDCDVLGKDIDRRLERFKSF